MMGHYEIIYLFIINIIFVVLPSFYLVYKRKNQLLIFSTILQISATLDDTKAAYDSVFLRSNCTG